MPLPPSVDDVLRTAAGRAHRDETALPGSGGPAGNARLTAWLGLLLLVLFLAQLITLFDVRGLITWHLSLGLLLLPPSLVKTATTGWRVARYYTGSQTYGQAGPPPLLLRLLGPLVVLTTLALLGTGILLIAVGSGHDHDPLLTVLGQQVSCLTLHQVTFFAWAGATALHVLARLVPALQLSAPGHVRVPGRARRAGVLLATTAVAAVTAVVVVGAAASWTGGDLGRDGGHERGTAGPP